MGYLGGSVVKNPPANSGDIGLIPGLRRSPGGNGNSFQYSCLGNPKDRGTWGSNHGVRRVGHNLVIKHEINIVTPTLQIRKLNFKEFATYQKAPR